MDGVDLSVLVPHYNESAATCAFLFDSLNSQNGVDLGHIEVIVCDDGPGCPNINDALCGRKYPIRHIKTDIKVGVSAVRNRLMREARGEYVLFCDADDGFCRDSGLADAFKIIFDTATERPEIVVFDYFAEKRDGKMDRHYNSSHIHAKFFNKKFLDESNIVWPEHISHNEDSAFVPPLGKMAKRGVRNTDIEPFYVWKYNPNSVTRRETGLTYCIKYFVDFVHAAQFVADRYSIGPKRRRDMDALSTAYYSYRFLNSDNVRNGPDEYRKYYDESCRAIAQLCADTDMALINTAEFENIIRCRQNDLKYLGIGAKEYETTFVDWMNGIMEKKNGI